MDNTYFLYFYSAAAQSMAALFTVGGLFAVYQLQSINTQITITCNAIRGFIERYYFVPATWAYGPTPPYNVNRDYDVWLEKDFISHLEPMIIGEDSALGKRLLLALIDYYAQLESRYNLAHFLKIFILPLITYIGWIFFQSMSILSQPHIIEDKVILNFITKSLIGVTIYTIIYVFIAIKGPKDLLVNNPQRRNLAILRKVEEIRRKLEERNGNHGIAHRIIYRITDTLRQLWRIII